MKKEVFSWAMFDFAETGFSALFITLFFPILIKTLGGSAFQIGAAMGLAMLLAAVVVPFIGAWSDAYGPRKPFVFFFVSACCGFAILAAFAPLWLALVFGMLAVLSYHAALDTYDALLPVIAKPRVQGTISGIGVLFGYIGSIVSQGMAYVVLSLIGWNTLSSTQAALVGSALFFFLFSQVLFVWTPDCRTQGILLKRAAGKGFFQLCTTLAGVRKNANAWLFLLSSLLYTDGMHTAIIFLYVYGNAQLGITQQQFFPLYAGMTVAAGIGAFMFGKLVDQWKPKKVLLILVGTWAAVVLLLFLKTSMTTYLLVGIVGALCLGGVWTATRPMLLSLVPRNQVAEYMGFQGLTEKFSGVLGPPLFGYLTTYVSPSAGMFSLLFFFVLGFLVLTRVRA